MREIVIKSKKHGTHIAVVDDDDFQRVSKYKWSLRKENKTNNTFYVRSMTFKKRGDNATLLHRLITNAPDGYDVDHANGNGLDNRRGNLRVCTHQMNGANQKTPKHNTTGFKGVSGKGNKFRAYIKVNYKQVYLGTFSTAIEAANAYNLGAQKYFGEFAKLNQL